MPFNDDKFGTLWPTRTGIATGSANERKMLDAIGGSSGFRTRIKNNADGSTTMVRTKDGAPQFSTEVKKDEVICPVERGPIIEALYAHRTFWDEDTARFSYDGLYSIGMQKTKTIEVSLPNGVYKKTSHICLARPVFTGEASQLTTVGGELVASNVDPAVRVGASDFFEGGTGRTYRLVDSKAISSNSVGVVAFLAKYAVKAIALSRNTCAARKLSLDYTGQRSASAANGLLGGSYQVDAVTRTDGFATDITHALASGDALMRITLGGTDNGKGGFLEEIHPLDLAGMSNYTCIESDGVTPVTWPILREFGSPLKGFFCSLGLFTDETRAVPIVSSGFSPAVGNEPVAAGGWLAPVEPRYFNFNPSTNVELTIPNSNALLKPDAVFNTTVMGDWPYGYSHSAPGMPFGELRSDEHLYKDGNGAVWVIRVEIYPANPGDFIDQIKFIVKRRFDQIFRTQADLNVSLGLFDVTNEGNDPYDQPGPSMYPSSYFVVASLPNGAECAVTLYHPVTTTAIAKAVFSGDGAPDGSGISVSVSQAPTWIESSGSIIPAGAGTVVEDSKSKIFTAYDASGITFSETDFARSDEGYRLHSVWASTAPTGETCGPFTSTYNEHYDWNAYDINSRVKRRNIRLFPTKGNTWKPVVVEWELTTESWIVTKDFKDGSIDTTTFLNRDTSPTHSLSGTFLHIDSFRTRRFSRIAYICGDQTAETSITLDYGNKTTTSGILAHQSGYNGGGVGLWSNARFTAETPVEEPFDTLVTDCLSGSPLTPYPYQHSYRCEMIETVQPSYTGEIVMNVDSSQVARVGITQNSLFSGLEYPSTWVNNAGNTRLVCCDLRNDRLWVAPTEAEGGPFY